MATDVNQKERNCNAVYECLYRSHEASRQAIVEALDLSLPTVTGNLALLEKNGLIQKQGTYSSTGGRPAVMYHCRSDARYAVGVEIRADAVIAASVDLYGAIIQREEMHLSFADSEAYYARVGAMINAFIAALPDTQTRMLGVVLAVQGIVSEDGHRLVFSGLLDNARITTDDFKPYMDHPFQIVHDAEAAGYAEFRQFCGLPAAAYLSLNPHMGSAMCLNGKLMMSRQLGAGTVEHMKMIRGGRRCYCGGHGCADTLVGVTYLLEKAGCSLEEFFTKLRQGDAAAASLFDDYMEDLSDVIYNVRMITDCDIILGGMLEGYLSDKNLDLLKKKVTEKSSLGNTPFQLVRGRFGEKAAVIGAGLMLVDAFLADIFAALQTQ